MKSNRNLPKPCCKSNPDYPVLQFIGQAARLGDNPIVYYQLRLMVRTLLTACILVFSVASSAQAASKCSEPAEGSAAYARAADAVRHLSEFRAWSKSHSFPVAFGTPNDKEVLVQGLCYWSVSVYADRPERLELWRVFLVRSPSKVAFVEDPESGSPVSLSAWHSQSKVSGKKP